MEKLINFLTGKTKELNDRTFGRHNLTKEFLDSLYSVYPFNRFEYVISHLIAEHITYPAAVS